MKPSDTPADKANADSAPADDGSGYRVGPSTTPVVGRRTVLTGALGLAAGAALAPSAATAARGAAAGARIYSYGHSYSIMPSPYVARKRYDEYPLQLGRRLGSGPVFCRGRSGTVLLDTISAIIAPTFAGTTGRRWHIGDRGLVLLHNMMNDAARQIGGDSDYLNAYEKAMRLALGVFGARSFIHADHASRVGGGWKAKRYSRLENGRTWYTTRFGDSMSFKITGGDSVHVSSLCTDPHELTQGTLRADCNGVTLGYFGRALDKGSYVCNRAKTYIDTVDDVTRNRWTPAGWRIAGLNAAAGTRGTKTLTLYKVDMTPAPVWVQGAYLTSGQGPPVLVAMEPPRNPSATGRTGVDAFYRNDARYRALISAVCKEYGAAYAVDLRPGWSNTTMVSSLDTSYRFHPNTRGMSCIADNFERTVKAYLKATTPGLH